MMYKKPVTCFIVSALLALASCKQHYELTSVSRSRILIDKRYDARPEPEAQAFLAPYKHKVDSIMSPVVGEVSAYMAAGKPESSLSNLLADILQWGGKSYGERVDFAVYNMGGIRAAFAKGRVTYGDVVDVAPFENQICFLSHGVNLVTSGRKLLDCRLNGEPIDDNKTYRVATLDYLAQGNDKLEAFKSGTDVVSPQTQENNVRFIIMNYFRDQMAQGKAVSREVEGRIIVK